MAQPGNYFTLTLIDQSLVIIRGQDNVIRGFYNVCPHRAHELIPDEQGNKKIIFCPYYAWAFDTSGHLKSARGTEKVAGFDPSTVCVSQFKVELFCGFIFINLDPEARPMAAVYPEVEAGIRQLNRRGSLTATFKCVHLDHAFTIQATFPTRC